MRNHKDTALTCCGGDDDINEVRAQDGGNNERHNVDDGDSVVLSIWACHIYNDDGDPSGDDNVANEEIYNENGENKTVSGIE